MKKVRGIFAVILSISLLFSVFSINVYANEGTDVSVTIVGTDNTLARAEAYATVRTSLDIEDVNHFGTRNVEVWAIAKTELVNWYSATANGIPDWTLMAMCQLWVNHKKHEPQYITSPTCAVNDYTEVSATTKLLHTYDGGSARAIGYHTVKDYYGEIVYTNETDATESF